MSVYFDGSVTYTYQVSSDQKERGGNNGIVTSQ